MALIEVLLGTGVLLAVILLALLLVLTLNGKPAHKPKKVKEDIKKIKDQINGD
jgi:hypothetical protein